MNGQSLARAGLSTLTLGAMLVFASGDAGAALTLVNGDFETGSFSGWTSTSGPAPTFGVDPFGPKLGSFSAYFGGTEASDSIAQTLAGNSDANSYSIAFFLGNPVGGGTGGRFEVRFDGTLVFALDAATIVPFQQFSAIGHSASTNPTLTFAGFHRNDYFTLDSVTVTAVPEPTMLSIVGLVGLMAVAASRRKRGPRRS